MKIENAGIEYDEEEYCEDCGDIAELVCSCCLQTFCNDCLQTDGRCKICSYGECNCK